MPQADLDELIALARLTDEMTRAPAKPPENEPYGTGSAELFRIILIYDRAEYEAMTTALDAMLAERDLDSYSDLVRDLVGVDATA